MWQNKDSAFWEINKLNKRIAELEADKRRLLVIENLINECTGAEITIARRRDGYFWITGGENTLSGSDVNAAIDAAMSKEQQQ